MVPVLLSVLYIRLCRGYFIKSCSLTRFPSTCVMYFRDLLDLLSATSSVFATYRWTGDKESRCVGAREEFPLRPNESHFSLLEHLVALRSGVGRLLEQKITIYLHLCLDLSICVLGFFWKTVNCRKICNKRPQKMTPERTTAHVSGIQHCGILQSEV